MFNRIKKEPPAPLTALDKKIIHLQHLRWFCRCVVVFATSMSVWANWLHSDKNQWAITINIMPPLLVLAGYEIIARVPGWENPYYGKHWWWWLHPRGWITTIAMGGITGIGAWLSYFHQKDAFLTYAKDASTAMLLPLAIDGLMIIASIKVLDLNARIEKLEAFREAGAINTYTLQQPKKTDAPPLKKEQIVAILKKAPTLTLPEVAGRTGATLPYVNAIARDMGDARANEPRRRRSRNHKPQMAEATA